MIVVDAFRKLFIPDELCTLGAYTGLAIATAINYYLI